MPGRSDSQCEGREAGAGPLRFGATARGDQGGCGGVTLGKEKCSSEGESGRRGRRGKTTEGDLGGGFDFHLELRGEPRRTPRRGGMRSDHLYAECLWLLCGD